MLGEEGTLPEGCRRIRIGFLLSGVPHPGLQNIDPVLAAGQIQVGTTQLFDNLLILTFRVQPNYPLTALQNIAQQQFKEITFSLAGVAQNQHIGVGLILVPPVQVRNDGAAVLVISQIKALGVGFTGVRKREKVGHTGRGEHPLEFFPEGVIPAGHH